jgi:microcystin-dependent protein
MTFTTDPPAVGDISLIPNADEKADLNAPSGSGGKLVVGQAPNITITETSVVADAAERLQLDVQEGDVAIQTNVSTSFIFTGGDNVAPNWETLDFDAVGAIDGEDIDPSGISGANIDTASAGQLIESDGSGGLQFGSPAGGVPTGGIIMWSGSIANIPSGFALCDGTSGTPDLTDRFVVGAGGSDYNVGDTGGQEEVQLSVAELPSHKHDFTAFTVGSQSGSGTFESRFDLAGETPQTENTGGDQPHENRPPYYALAYIMKT